VLEPVVPPAEGVVVPVPEVPVFDVPEDVPVPEVPDVEVPEPDVPELEVPPAGGVVVPVVVPEPVDPVTDEPPEPGVNATIMVSMRLVHPKDVSEPSVPSQGLENSAHLPSFETWANPSP